jgi:hypothetical protein
MHFTPTSAPQPPSSATMARHQLGDTASQGLLAASIEGVPTCAAVPISSITPARQFMSKEGSGASASLLSPGPGWTRALVQLKPALAPFIENRCTSLLSQASGQTLKLPAGRRQDRRPAMAADLPVRILGSAALLLPLQLLSKMRAAEMPPSSSRRHCCSGWIDHATPAAPGDERRLQFVRSGVRLSC